MTHLFLFANVGSQKYPVRKHTSHASFEARKPPLGTPYNLKGAYTGIGRVVENNVLTTAEDCVIKVGLGIMNVRFIDHMCTGDA